MSVFKKLNKFKEIFPLWVKQISLRCALFVLAGFVFGLTLSFIYFKGQLEKEKSVKTTTLEGFIIKETKEQIDFFDKQGNKILIIDKR